MSEEESVGKLDRLQQTLDGVMRQLQITQAVVEQLRTTVRTLCGGKLLPIPIPPEAKSEEDGILTLDIQVPVQPVLIRYTAVTVKPKSKIATLGD